MTLSQSQLPGVQKESRGPTLFVYNLPANYSEETLQQIFQPYGSLTQVSVAREKNNQSSRGFGFVSYDSYNSAMNAIQNLNGAIVEGKQLQVSFKTEKMTKLPDRRGGGGDFYGSGRMNGGGNQMRQQMPQGGGFNQMGSITPIQPQVWPNQNRPRSDNNQATIMNLQDKINDLTMQLVERDRRIDDLTEQNRG
ncbi:MAG: hypothetical protein EZS28_017799 [Streblomastix strix]|uniref:RRM domain-containing protein n=1 Tax=Streblomastix strix TaxID=222440 RepID=A0A5J4VW06_9EUKA|nr:MAG: hypothetical protein EZS28_017799 [Streblomastix strix]